MNPVTIGESCKECGSMDFTYIDRLGERTCDDCGLVLVLNPFEETTHMLSISDTDRRSKTIGRLGSFIRKSDAYGNKDKFALYREQVRSQPETETDRNARLLINSTLSYYNVSDDLRRRAQKYYDMMKRDLFRGLNVERRCASLTFYVLKEADIVCNIQEHSRRTLVRPNDISRFARRIARHQRNSTVFITRNHEQRAQTLMSRMEVDIDDYFRANALRLVEYVSRHIESLDMRFADTMLAACIWMTGQMMSRQDITQSAVCKHWNSSHVGLRGAVVTLSDVFQIERKRLSDMQVEDFVSGVRY
tara:strand:+ start:4632 stop:5543 length:912 start_codon:yes stop_codon:yes gene_type:complete